MRAAKDAPRGGLLRQIRYTEDMTAGELLQDARHRHGVTQKQLAARARTSQAAISRIERGNVSPSVGTLATLLDLLGEELELAARPIDYGHDPTLNERNLRMTPAQRIDHGADFANFTMRTRGAAARG
jgi:transcriptional regulator with XRE-family HTH domain